MGLAEVVFILHRAVSHIHGHPASVILRLGDQRVAAGSRNGAGENIFLRVLRQQAAGMGVNLVSGFPHAVNQIPAAGFLHSGMAAGMLHRHSLLASGIPGSQGRIAHQHRLAVHREEVPHIAFAAGHFHRVAVPDAHAHNPGLNPIGNILRRQAFPVEPPDQHQHRCQQNQAHLIDPLGN